MFSLRKRRSAPQETELPRTKAAVLAAGGPLFVPRNLLQETFEAFVPYWRAGVETAAFWAGPDSEHLRTLTTLVLPTLFQTPGNYQVQPGSQQRLAHELREQGLIVHAQVHTHPSRWVGHSPTDDAQAYTTAEGGLSLVWPEYGRPMEQDLAAVGFHVRRGGRWVPLKDSAEREAHLRVVDSVIDLRWSIAAGRIHDKE
ncbi:hypothetical protein GCM10008957_46390 [Deinococcus ruber]|uniref:JAB domain-containing protein n=1 Tax=Deinococcus ruber TaxID=1848197 RepID=A0A918CL61_9DEIO|nr:hypothetical protein GCM10008957_46390 [Deinococcus ruber]